MHRFDYSEIKGNIPEDILSLVKSISIISSQDSLRESNYRAEYEKITDIAKLASVKYSNEIEGIITTDERLNELILRGGRPLNHTEEEISGYGEALNLIHSNPNEINFDERTITLLHSMIRAGRPEDRGHYKERDNVIVDIDNDGKRHLVYVPVSAKDTKECMEQLILAYMDADGQDYEPLLLIPCIILDYLCIHPFIDGNGRTSRLLTTMLLYQHGMNICKFISMDEHIASTKERYYRALWESSNGWKENGSSYFPFIRYFLQTLYECYIDLDTRFLLVNGKKLKKNQRIEKILSDSLTPLSIRQINMILPDISINTISSKIKSMMKEGKVEKVGNFRNARYIMKDKMKDDSD